MFSLLRRLFLSVLKAISFAPLDLLLHTTWIGLYFESAFLQGLIRSNFAGNEPRICHSISMPNVLTSIFSVRSGIQNITELSDWRKEYAIVVKWIEINEKKLAALGEPGDQAKDLTNKCTTLDVSVNRKENKPYSFVSVSPSSLKEQQSSSLT